MAIILVEQYFEFAYDLADQFVVLRRGEVILSGEKKVGKRRNNCYRRSRYKDSAFCI